MLSLDPLRPVNNRSFLDNFIITTKNCDKNSSIVLLDILDSIKIVKDDKSGLVPGCNCCSNTLSGSSEKIPKRSFCFPITNKYDNKKNPSLYYVNSTNDRNLFYGKVWTKYDYTWCHGIVREQFTLTEAESPSCRRDFSKKPKIISSAGYFFEGDIHDNIKYHDFDQMIDVETEQFDEDTRRGSTDAATNNGLSDPEYNTTSPKCKFGSYHFKKCDTEICLDENNYDLEIEILNQHSQPLYTLKGQERIQFLENLWCKSLDDVRSDDEFLKHEISVRNPGDLEAQNSEDSFNQDMINRLKDSFVMNIYSASASSSSKNDQNNNNTKNTNNTNNKKILGQIIFKREQNGQKVIEVVFPKQSTLDEKFLIVQACLAIERKVSMILMYQDVTLDWMLRTCLPLMFIVFCLGYFLPFLMQVLGIEGSDLV